MSFVPQPLHAERTDGDARLARIGVGAIRPRDVGVREVELRFLLGAEALLLHLLLLVVTPADAIAPSRLDLVRRDASHGLPRGQGSAASPAVGRLVRRSGVSCA